VRLHLSQTVDPPDTKKASFLSLSQPPIFLYHFRVSTLSHFDFCCKRAKLELFNQVEKGDGENKSMVKGTEMHWEFSVPYKSFDRRLLRYRLEQKYGRVFQKQVDNIVIRGSYDDLRVLFNRRTQTKWVTLIEVKTTNKPKMWYAEIKAAIFQLQLYIFLMKDAITGLGWNLHKRHWLEIYSQKDKRLIKRIMVEADPDIENKIRYIVRAFQGIAPWRYPEPYVCRICPRKVKDKCPLYQSRKKGI